MVKTAARFKTLPETIAASCAATVGAGFDPTNSIAALFVSFVSHAATFSRDDTEDAKNRQSIGAS